MKEHYLHIQKNNPERIPINLSDISKVQIVTHKY